MIINDDCYNEFTVSQGNENWEPIFSMTFGCFGEDKNLFPPLGSETRSQPPLKTH